MQWMDNLIKYPLIRGKKLLKIILFDSVIFVSEDKVIFVVPMTVFKKYFRVVVIKGMMDFKCKIWLPSFFFHWHGWGSHKSTLKNILWHFKFKTTVNSKIWLQTDLGTRLATRKKETFQQENIFNFSVFPVIQFINKDDFLIVSICRI